jgi:hypothetical protein
VTLRPLSLNPVGILKLATLVSRFNCAPVKSACRISKILIARSLVRASIAIVDGALRIATKTNFQNIDEILISHEPGQPGWTVSGGRGNGRSQFLKCIDSGSLLYKGRNVRAPKREPNRDQQDRDKKSPRSELPAASLSGIGHIRPRAIEPRSIRHCCFGG